ncbi:MAG: hypothetical protein VB056_02585 [Sphaerochaeta associata]|uniref:hypothetical protein n=1 Tax=Sphaerochaeta associata TaxID=1129264 RepID=UPI002B21A042|nr:hypothetical protein [Sphaerochaeta associata]MEA5027741.1 hypothetical protein [Sphaerochaeta associata]
MGMTKVRDGAKIERGAGSFIREASPDDLIYNLGWFVGEISLENLLHKTRKDISEADENMKDSGDTSKQ